MRAPLLALLLLGSALHTPAQVLGVTGMPVVAPTQQSAAKGHLSGHVFCDDTHRPARGALVMVTNLPSATPGAAQGSTMAIAHVRSDGSYTIDHLTPGDYTAIAVYPGYLSALTELLTNDAQSSDPAYQRDLLARNGTFSVRAGGSAAFDITLHRGAALSGQILYSDGAPAAGVSLMVEDATAKASPDADKTQEQLMAQVFAQRLFAQQNSVTDDQGRFRLSGLKPGTYRLAATEPLSVASDASDTEGMGGMVSLMGIADPRALRFYAGDTTHRASAKTFNLRPGDEVSGIQITLPTDAFHEIHGTLAAKDGRIIDQAQITLTDIADPQITFHAAIQRDGTFVLSQIPAGNYTLAASNAHITEASSEGPPNLPEQYRPRKSIAAFADANLTVLVQDHDLEGVSLTLGEVPLSKDQATPSPAADDL